MATHKKTPLFIRIIASNKEVVCFNPHQLSSFRIREKAKHKVKRPDGEEVIEADTIHLYFPAGTGLTYVVGVDITQEQFDYVCSTLIEFLYLNEAEFKAKSEAIQTARMNEWNKISEENSIKIDISKEALTTKEA